MAWIMLEDREQASIDRTDRTKSHREPPSRRYRGERAERDLCRRGSVRSRVSRLLFFQLVHVVGRMGERRREQKREDTGIGF
jgi:hypothetical protein